MPISIVEHARDVALIGADMQYNPGSTPSAFLGTAAFFGGISTAAFFVAKRTKAASASERLTKTAAVAVGLGAAGLASLDTATYFGHRMKGTQRSDPPTVVERMLHSEAFEKALDSPYFAARFAGVAAVVVHARVQDVLEPNYKP